MFELQLPRDAGVSIIGGKQRMEGPQLEGHAPSTRCRASCRRAR